MSVYVNNKQHQEGNLFRWLVGKENPNRFQRGGERWVWQLANGIILEMRPAGRDRWYVPSTEREKAAIINSGGIVTKYFIRYKDQYEYTGNGLYKLKTN